MSETQEEIVVDAKVVDEKKEIAVATTNTQLSTNAFGNLEDFRNYYKMAQQLASSDMVPQSYQGKPMNCLIALEQAQRMNASPLMVMQNLYVVKGKPSWSGQACSMIVNGCGLFENVDLCYVGERGKDNRGAYVKATRKSDGKEIEGTLVDIKMVKAEGWDKNPKWHSMTDQMLGYRAYSFFARLYCPNALSGFSTEGEIEDIEASKRKKKADNPFVESEVENA